MKYKPLIKIRKLDSRNRLVIPAPLSDSLTDGAGVRLCPGRVVGVVYPKNMLKRGLYRNIQVIISELYDELRCAGEI